MTFPVAVSPLAVIVFKKITAFVPHLLEETSNVRTGGIGVGILCVTEQE